MEKEEWRWCSRRPGKPACPPHGKPHRKGYCNWMVLISRSIRRGWTSVCLDGPNPPIGGQAHGQVPLGVKKSVEPPLQIYPRTRKSLIMITFWETCRSMREYLMVIIESEAGKIPTLICRSCACRRLGKVGDLIFPLSLPIPNLPEIQAIHTESKLTQVRWERERGSTCVTVIASGNLHSLMASLLTASQQSTNKRSSKK